MTISLPTHTTGNPLKRNHQKAKWKTTFLWVSMPNKFSNFFKSQCLKATHPFPVRPFLKHLPSKKQKNGKEW